MAAPVNARGYCRVMFDVEGIDDVVARTVDRGAGLMGEMRYGDPYRLAYIRGPDGIIVGLAEPLGWRSVDRPTPPTPGSGGRR